MRQWYCARTNPKQERLAKQQLERQGMPVFLPSYLVRHPNRHIVVRTLFRNYIFVSLDDPRRWPLIANSVGIESLLLYQPMDSEYKLPSPIGSDAIEMLRAQALSFDEIRRGGGKRVEVQQPDQIITEHCYVRILTGPFAVSTEKALVQWTSEERVGLLIEIFGRSCKAEFYHKDVELVQRADGTMVR